MKTRLKILFWTLSALAFSFFMSYFVISISLSLTTYTSPIRARFIPVDTTMVTPLTWPEQDDQDSSSEPVEIPLDTLQAAPIQIANSKNTMTYLMLYLPADQPEGTYAQKYVWSDGTELSNGGMLRLSSDRYLQLDFLDIIRQVQDWPQDIPKQGLSLELEYPRVHMSGLQRQICAAVFSLTKNHTPISYAITYLAILCAAAISMVVFVLLCVLFRYEDTEDADDADASRET